MKGFPGLVETPPRHQQVQELRYIAPSVTHRSSGGKTDASVAKGLASGFVF
jgi:hypothetical protein